MMKTPCLVAKSAGPSPVQGPSWKSGLFSKVHFPWAILGVWGCVTLFLREKVVWGQEVAPGQPRLPVGSFALHWIKPDLLNFFWLQIFRSQQLVFPRVILHLENTPCQRNIFKPNILLCKIAANLYSRSEYAGMMLGWSRANSTGGS